MTDNLTFKLGIGLMHVMDLHPNLNVMDALDLVMTRKYGQHWRWRAQPVTNAHLLEIVKDYLQDMDEERRANRSDNPG